MGPYVCVPCGREMKIEKTGIVAIEYTSAVGTPYKAYSFDKFKCPKCGHEVLLGHGDPVGHYRDDFKKWQNEAELTFY